MIRMSKEADYGIIILAHFAGQAERLTHSAREVATETQLPFPMVSKILKILAREGFLISQRGAKGGYILERQPSRISVAEIIHSVEGPIAMTECIEAPGECKHEPQCRLRNNWYKINETVIQALRKITLSDMITPLPDLLVPLRGIAEGRRV
jgi:FeS assembly SUF system regulator